VQDILLETTSIDYRTQTINKIQQLPDFLVKKLFNLLILLKLYKMINVGNNGIIFMKAWI